ncbi:hypothetical protein NSK_003321 [Nannochloropsis salina CCMP1776]|uniref:Protein ENHANCED DISEASE RESISTANCE 2 C-terminal domain-containing protein n=1 Tax=Nannochloropsis salina CCMP1776 TaxID=1027361 RepID=A0A4D9D1D5_9STRA|nr:hypothetical protein NSK_003321 [Nannochloropsis salina CCMP1776]|eukprot:TFJ85362.1 hypothetical protein NSK_003321 [Nannochloropsis salina CCMP1776]
MAYVKRLWKRGVRRQSSFETKPRSDSQTQIDLLLEPSSALANDVDGRSRISLVPGSEASSSRHQQDDRMQQEALVGALQTTVLEQSRKLKDLSRSIDRLHGENRRAGHHIEALRSLLGHVTGCDLGGSGPDFQMEEVRETEEKEGRMLALEDETAPVSDDQASGVTNIASRGIAPGAFSTTQGAITEEGPGSSHDIQGVYAYLSSLVASATWTLFPSVEPLGGSLASAASSSSTSYADLPSLAFPASTGAGSRKSVSTSVEDTQALLMGQILEKLHLAEDRYAFQAEEIHAYHKRLEGLEEEAAALRVEKQRYERLLLGLKRELTAYKNKLQARDYKEATMEVEIDRYRHEKQRMTRMLSEVVDSAAASSAPASATNTPGPQELGEYFPLPGASPLGTGRVRMGSLEGEGLPPPRPLPPPHPTTSSVQTLALGLDAGRGGRGGGTGGAPAAPSPSNASGKGGTGPGHPSGHPRMHPSSPSKCAHAAHAFSPQRTPPPGRRHWPPPSDLVARSPPTAASPLPSSSAAAMQALTQARVEMAALQAELDAARAVSEVETVVRAGERGKAGGGRERVGGGGGPGIGGVGGGGRRVEDRWSGEEDVEDREVTTLVIKEQLSSLRELNPAFHVSWGDATTEWKVRGRTYMADGVKVGGRAAEPLCELVHMELFEVESAGLMPRADHVTALFQRKDGVYSRCQLLASQPPPFLIILNFQIPGHPPCSMMCYFALCGARRQGLEKARERVRRRKAREGAVAAAEIIGEEQEEGEEEEEAEEEGMEDLGGGERVQEKREEKKFLRLLAEFLEGDDEEKNRRFKLIPSIIEGPALVRLMVGNKPVLLGNKLTQRYWTGPGYLEIGIDIGSSAMASRTLGFVRDGSKNVVVELAVLVQGEDEKELPEKVLGSLRCSRLDWGLAEGLKGRLEAAVIARTPSGETC